VRNAARQCKWHCPAPALIVSNSSSRRALLVFEETRLSARWAMGFRTVFLSTASRTLSSKDCVSIAYHTRTLMVLYSYTYLGLGRDRYVFAGYHPFSLVTTPGVLISGHIRVGVIFSGRKGEYL
jgi:hypothetical protein